MLDRSVESLIGLVDNVRSPDVRTYLRGIQQDQGAMLQLSPEAMDLMAAGFEDRAGVHYQSTASMSPAPSLSSWLRMVGHPWHALSLALFSALHRLTADIDALYPCAQEPTKGEAASMLTSALGQTPQVGDNDGCVPIRSQVWGQLVWAGLGDHLDVLGHYRDETRPVPGERDELRHHDWLTSGSHFNDASFAALMDRVAQGMIAAS
jgi:hypothetical protein